MHHIDRTGDRALHYCASATDNMRYDMHEFYVTAIHVLVVGSYSIPGGGSLLAFQLPTRVYRWGGRVGVSTLEIQVLSKLIRGSVTRGKK